MTTSRKTVRKAIGAALKVALEGTGKPAQEVYDHLPNRFKASPVLCVLSNGTRTIRQGIGNTRGKNAFRFSLMMYQIVPTDENGWNQTDAQDKQDDLEAATRAWVLANPISAGNWQHLVFAESLAGGEGHFTEIVAVKVNGVDYELETIEIEVEAYDS